MVADNSGSGATTSTRIEDSERNPQIIPGQKSALLTLLSRRTSMILWGFCANGQIRRQN